MKSKLQIILTLLLIFALDGLVLAETTNGGSPAFSPDGISVAQTQRRRRRRRQRRKARQPTPYQISVPPAEAGSAPESPPTPAQQPAPAQQEMPVMAAPPPPAADPMDAPGRGRPAKKAGPTRIKPPTVQIKPPTR